MTSGGTIGGHEAMELWDHPRAIDGHRGLCMAQVSFHCLGLYYEMYYAFVI